MSNKRLLKNFIRVDGSGRMISSSNVLRQKMPKVGKWVEIAAYQCCNSNLSNINLFLTFLDVSDDTIYTFDLGARTVAVTLVAGTDVTALVASFAASPSLSSIKIGAVDQVGEVTANDFTNPVIYTVIAADGVTTANWIVTVTVTP